MLLGHVSSDYLEGRFSWYRQSSGAYYNISVLQILQAEKTTRIRSLIDSGLKISDLKDILITYLSVMTSDLYFSESLVVPNDDQAIICYVARAIVRSLIKKVVKQK